MVLVDTDLPTAPRICEEQTAVYLRRYKEAREAGLSIVEARMFAESGADIGELRRLVESGCPPALIAQIAL